jgi:putative endonuclease
MIRRIKAQSWGRWAEQWAVLALRLKGYGIVARHVTGPRRTGVGEVDIIARRGSVLAFIEVKARPDVQTAMLAITPQQQARICRAAQAFVTRHPALANLTLRFDAILVTPWHWPHHVPNAWSAP